MFLKVFFQTVIAFLDIGVSLKSLFVLERDIMSFGWSAEQNKLFVVSLPHIEHL